MSNPPQHEDRAAAFLLRLFGPPFPGVVAALSLVLLLLAIQTLFMLIVGIQAGAVSMLIPLRQFNPEELLYNPIILGLTNGVSSVAVIGLSLFAIDRTFRDSFALRGFKPLSLVPATLSIAGLTIVAAEAGNFVQDWMPLSDDATEMFLELMGDEGSFLAAFITVCLVAPIGEELFARGLLMSGFLRRYRPVAAILLCAVVFSAMHLIPQQILLTLPVSLLLTWWRWRTGSVFFCILGHALYNSTGLLHHAGLEVPGFNVYQEGVSFHLPVWLTLFGAVLLGVGLLGQRYDFGRYPPPQELI